MIILMTILHKYKSFYSAHASDFVIVFTGADKTRLLILYK